MADAGIIFFFNDTATTEIYTLSLHDALPICTGRARRSRAPRRWDGPPCARALPTSTSRRGRRDRKSTRLNSSHSQISYAVFCLKKKHKQIELLGLHVHFSALIILHVFGARVR